MFFMDMPYANEIMWLLSTPVVLWLGKDFFINAWKQAKHRSANMDTLVALSTGIAYLFSVFNILFADFWLQRGLQAHVYFEAAAVIRSEEHTSELQSLMRISYAVFCLKKKN